MSFHRPLRSMPNEYKDINLPVAADTYGSDAAVATFGVHYQVNSLGSRQIATK